MKIRNPNIPKDIRDELEYLEESHFTFDKPVKFLEGLTLYPVTVRNYNEFLSCSACMTLNKNEDPMGITMTNLAYLISKMTDKEMGRITTLQFSRLVELIFKLKNGIKCKKCGRVYSYREYIDKLQSQVQDEQNQEAGIVCDDCGCEEFMEVIKYQTNPQTNQKELVIDGVVVGNEDFNRLRQIVLYQNLPDYQDDSWVDSQLKADEEKKRELLRKKNNVSATLEKKIVCVSAKSCYKIEELYDMTIRKFLMLLTAIDDALTYEATRVGMMTGMVSMKEPPEHWIYKKNDSMYGKASTLDAYKEKIR